MYWYIKIDFFFFLLFVGRQTYLFSVTPLKIKRQELVHRQKRNVCTKSFYDNNSITISFSRSGIKKWFCKVFEKDWPFFKHLCHGRNIRFNSFYYHVTLCMHNELAEFSTSDHQLSLNLGVMSRFKLHVTIYSFHEKVPYFIQHMLHRLSYFLLKMDI